MAFSLSFLLLLLLLLPSITASPLMPPPPPPLASPPIPPPPRASPPTKPSLLASPPPREQRQQLNNIIDALIGTGDFGGWTDLLSSADPSTLPMTATLFIPSDDATEAATAAASSTLDPLIFPYHIVPQRLTFSDLQRFTAHSRLPTLLPTMSILITNNTPSNFTVDDSPIIHPDLYLASGVSVHGIASVLDYSLYGKEAVTSKPSPPPEVVTALPTSTPPPPPPSVAGGTWDSRSSDAACLCTEFPIVFSVVCAVIAFKIQRIPLNR